MRDPSGATAAVANVRHTDRLRAGLTGLGLVVVVVVLTGANMRPAPMRAADAPAGETLAVLGVAPSSDRGEAAGAPATATATPDPARR